MPLAPTPPKGSSWPVICTTVSFTQSPPERVAAAWSQFAGRFAALARYTPVSARFDSARGTVYRLSVKGFASAGEAQRLCGSLQRKGGNCFVRQVAGDSPVRFAAR